MEISKDALLRIVKATRASIRLAGETRKLYGVNGSWTVLDEIAALMCDALQMISGEVLTEKEDFIRDSVVMKLLNGKLASDEEVAELLADMAEVRIPAPVVTSLEETEKMYRENGGYKNPLTETPEGEWTR